MKEKIVSTGIILCLVHGITVAGPVTAAIVLGKISFEGKTSAWFQALQKLWFDYWLKGIGDGKFAEANCFQTGSNKWKAYNTWPPKEAEEKKLYTHADGTCSFIKPTGGTGSVSYVSDPESRCLTALYPLRQLIVKAAAGIHGTWKTSVL